MLEIWSGYVSASLNEWNPRSKWSSLWPQLTLPAWVCSFKFSAKCCFSYLFPPSKKAWACFAVTGSDTVIVHATHCTLCTLLHRKIWWPDKYTVGRQHSSGFLKGSQNNDNSDSKTNFRVYKWRCVNNKHNKNSSSPSKKYKKTGVEPIFIPRRPPQCTHRLRHTYAFERTNLFSLAFQTRLKTSFTGRVASAMLCLQRAEFMWPMNNWLSLYWLVAKIEMFGVNWMSTLEPFLRSERCKFEYSD